MQSESGKSEATELIGSIGVRMPPFNHEDPELWFAVIEESFANSKITRDKTKFWYVLGVLDHRYQTEVRDIILNPPKQDSYELMKTELIKRLSTSQERKTLQLLEKETLGDRKPSQFLRYLRELAGTTVPDSMLRTIWTSLLPQPMQVALATQHYTTLTKQSEIADAISDTIRPSLQIAETTVAPMIDGQTEAWHFTNVKPRSTSNHGDKPIFVFKDLTTCSHVFVYCNAPKGPLENPYEGPFPVISRHSRHYLVKVRNRNVPISLDRLKPAYIANEEQNRELEDGENNVSKQEDPSLQKQVQSCLKRPGHDDDQQLRTCSRRRVRFPNKYQAGVS
ncbi:hypothetical protein FQR65_LT14084 [Abscondita terminalis]|nr:hypothetical protein FQR65_LT14084 [Abscondita terminalis]